MRHNQIFTKYQWKNNEYCVVRKSGGMLLSGYLFNNLKRLKESMIPLMGIIFFIFVFILCPITNLNSAGNDVNKTSDTTGVEEKGDDKTADPDTLYDYERPTLEDESYSWLIVKTIIVLAALVGGFYYFYRFVTKKAGIQTLGRDVIKILSIVPVGQNKYLQVVDLAGKIMVIGVSDASINLITEIKDRDEIDRIRLLSSKSGQIKKGGFQEYISKYVSRLLNKSTAGSTNAEGDYKQDIHGTEIDRLEFLKKQKDRLKKINGKNNEF